MDFNFEYKILVKNKKGGHQIPTIVWRQGPTLDLKPSWILIMRPLPEGLMLHLWNKVTDKWLSITHHPQTHSWRQSSFIYVVLWLPLPIKLCSSGYYHFHWQPAWPVQLPFDSLSVTPHHRPGSQSKGREPKGATYHGWLSGSAIMAN